MQLLLVKAGRNLYLDAITSKKLPLAAAGAVWDQMTSFLRASAITVVVLALVIAAVAWFTGRPRALATAGTAAARDRWRRSSAPTHRCSAASAAAIAFVVLVAWDNPTLLTVLGIVVVLIVYLAVIEVVGRGARTPQRADAS